MLLIINLKKYKRGKNLLELIKKIKKYKPKAVIGILPKDVNKIKGKKFSQYYTKKEEMKKFKGIFLNHSDYPLKFDKLKKQVNESKKLGLKVLVFSPNLAHVRKVKKIKPWAIAYEDKKLIGTGRSITTYKANTVKEFGKIMKGSGIIPVCGAGISNKEDIKAAKKLGCEGVAISSAVAKGSLKKAERFLKGI
ncbi:MAG: triose-phosphate isomerase [Candidatus Nanoarchaeia archaeon]